MGGQRLVVVYGLLQRFEPPKQGAGQSPKRQKNTAELEEWKGLASYAPGMPPSTRLVLYDDVLTGDNPLLKALSPVADVIQFKTPDSDKVRSFIDRYVTAAGGIINTEAVDMIEQLVGNDLWAISNEIDKVMAFCGGRAVSEKDIRLIVSNSHDENIFALADAILEGRAAEAQRSFARIVEAGTEPLAVIALVARQLRLTLRVKAMGAVSPSPELAGTLGVKPFVMRKTIAMAKKTTINRLKAVFGRLLEADIAVKSGRYKPDLAIVCLIGDLASAKGVDKA
jgi:DNA polymerase-3 subunit delta